MASSQPESRKRKIHHLLDLSDEEEDRLGPPYLRRKSRVETACNDEQHTPTKPCFPSPDTFASIIQKGHLIPAKNPYSYHPPKLGLQPFPDHYYETQWQPPDSPIEFDNRTGHGIAAAVHPINEDQPTQAHRRSKSRHDTVCDDDQYTPTRPRLLSSDTRARQCQKTQIQAFTPPAESFLDPAKFITDPDLLHFWQTQIVPPDLNTRLADPNGEPVQPIGYNNSPRIPPIDEEPTQERSPSATKPEPSPRYSRTRSPTKTPSPRSPIEWVYTNAINYEFGHQVCEAYERSKRRDRVRAEMYGEEVASEWKCGSTPEEVWNAYSAVKQEEYRRAWDLSPAQEGDSDWEGPEGPADTGVDTKPNDVSIREPDVATPPHGSLLQIQLPSHRPPSPIRISQYSNLNDDTCGRMLPFGTARGMGRL